VAKGYALLERGRLELEGGAADEASSSFIEGIHSARGDKALLAQAHLLKGLALDRLSQRHATLREYQNVLALPNIDETHRIASRFSKIPFQGGL
jgi:hypothetical protein